jgi:outer membrane lipoprotein carrier protein
MKGWIGILTASIFGQPSAPAKPAQVLPPVVAQVSVPAKPVVALTADEVVKKLQKFYDDTADFQGSFKQVYTYKAYGRTQKSQGQVFFKKSGKMRWNYSKPTSKRFITDGSKFWVYEPEEKQAFESTLEESQVPVVLTFLSGKGKLTDEFTAKLVTGDKRSPEASDYAVELTPKKATADYKGVFMVVSGVDFSLKEVFVYDAVDNENRISFSKISLNKGIDDSQFAFVPPSDVKIITNAPSSNPTE